MPSPLNIPQTPIPQLLTVSATADTILLPDKLSLGMDWAPYANAYRFASTVAASVVFEDT